MSEPAPPVPTISELDLPRLGVTHVDVTCERCHHGAKVPIGEIDDRQTIVEFATRLRCTACGAKSCTAMPSWPSAFHKYDTRAKNH